MKRTLLSLAVLAGASALAGCPIYSNQSDYRVCTGSACYDCPDPSYSSMCVPWSCNTDGDCGDGYSCSQAGSCVSAGDDASVPGDCSVSGCPSGEVCRLAGGTASCVTPSTDDAGPGEDAAAGSDARLDSPPSSSDVDASADGPSVHDAVAEGAPVDASDDVATPASEASVDSATASEAAASVACNANGDCSVGGWCIDGQCVSAAGLCSDGSQCAVAGEACVNGICVPHCSASAPCPAGYGCDFGLGVCDVNPAPCTGTGASSCQGGAVCVESHCVPPCGANEGGAACASGQVCINGGCIPDQAALFACKNDGASGQLANACDTSSVCVHHDCYTACDGDGGGCAAALCKQVTVHAGTYAVCGTATTLGSDCDYAAGAVCASSGVCVDGYCR